MPDDFDDFIDDVLDNSDEPPLPKPKRTGQPGMCIKLLTVDDFRSPHLRISKYLTALNAQRAISFGLMSDFKAAIRDVTGGRVASIEKKIEDAIKSIKNEMRRDADRQGATAIIGFGVSIAGLGHKDVVLIIGTGTPVILESTSQNPPNE